MRKTVGVIAIAAALGLAALPAAAQEQKFEIRAGESVKTLLDEAVGKTVTLLMSSGQEVTGTVAKVGDHAVQLTRLSGRDYFDGVILLERVDGVILKIRGK
jgi:small nuclear ribonucleoprotein (snRNP)-like protein